MFVFLAYGTTGTVARLLGAGEVGRPRIRACRALWVAAGIGALVAVVGSTFVRPAVGLMGAAPEVAPFVYT